MGRHENNWNTTPQVPKGQYMDMGKGKASKQLQACKYENAEGNRGGSLVFRPLLGYMVV